ncbi:MAG: protein-disulfide reductase DsbD family protein [Cyanobacteria bacterium]|nr:protein-disulfide reductase DsbD family protein [Cyanobacteriota bacterium]MDW8200396.1 protein-disulfide reductase DsbD family protein [Cyanobacteriota bacterium SKYGB_h_bin112]
MSVLSTVSQIAAKRVSRWLIGLAIALLLWIGLGWGDSAVWANPSAPENRVQASLVSEVTSIQPGTSMWVALHLKIREGWHVYWQNPGDSGAAPIVRWSLPEGFRAGELVYPYPERLPVPPLMNFGYKDEVYYLVKITPAANVPTGQSVTLRAEGEILVCKVECVPEPKSVSLTLPVTAEPPAQDPAMAAAFTRVRQALPQPSPWSVSFAVEETTLRLRVAVTNLSKGQVRAVEFFPYQDGVMENAADQAWTIDSDGLTLTVKRGYRDDLTTVDGVLVLQEQLDGQTITQAFDIRAVPGGGTATSSTSLALIGKTLLLALLGGVVLNLMPCVFPVLSLKALTIAQQAQRSPRQARIGGLAFTAGVLVSFALLAAALLLLRSLGQQVGWGFQLQSPGFVLIMAYVLFAVGLSLSGAFTIGASIMGLGSGLTARPGYSGEFFTGMLTTVMATPCTAPFMATAVSVALVQPPGVAIAVLLVLGLGLALPYLLISITPAVRRWLPKPGAWMEVLQQFLAFPIYGAAAWLVWVLTQQTGTNGLAIALTGLVLISFAAWLHQKTQLSRQVWRRVGMVGSLATLVLAVTLTPLVNQNAVPPDQRNATPQVSAWQPYSAQQVASLQQSNQPVFFNFTAAWCVTCLVNDRVALSQPEVIAAFQAKGVRLIKADWTNRDPDITQALSRYGHSGVPLYVLYPSGLSQGRFQILPKMLTPAIVQEALATVPNSVTRR